MKWFSQKRVSLGLILLVVGMMVVWYRGYNRSSTARRTEQILQAKLTEETLDNQQLLAKVAQAETDQYVIKIAREKLGLYQGGEIAYWVGESTSPDNSPEDSSELPFWRKWWYFLFKR